jgi:hypothetical protein
MKPTFDDLLWDLMISAAALTMFTIFVGFLIFF